MVVSASVTGRGDTSSFRRRRRRSGPTGTRGMPKSGDRVGRYVLESVLGTGGMGCVFRAFDGAMNRYVAIKIAKDPSPELARHFMQEGKAQSSIRHPHVMPVYDMGFAPDGRPFYVMELLYEPVELAEIIRLAQAGTLAARYPRVRSWRDTRQIVKDVVIPVCGAIHAVNERYGLVHRDLKPSNVLIDIRTRRPHVIDFGNCASLGDAPQDRHVIGTARFLAPEQARGLYHPRTDVWALGALLTCIVSGEPPIAASSPYRRAEIKRQLQRLDEEAEAAKREGREETAIDIATRRERIAALRPIEALFQDARAARYVPLPKSTPHMLRSIAHKALSADPDDRYASAALLAEDLEAYVQGRVTRATRGQARSGTRVRALYASVKRRRSQIGAVASGLVLGVLIGLSGLGSQPDVHDDRAADVLADLRVLAQRVTARVATPAGSDSTDRAACLLWRQDRAHLDRLRERLVASGSATGSQELEKLEAHLAHARLRVTGVRGRGWTLEDRHAQLHRRVPASGVLGELAPGRYRLRSSGTPFVSLPVGLPLDRAGVDIEIRIPELPKDAPEDVALLSTGSGSTGATVLITRTCVSCAQYAEWLDELPPESRLARVPKVGFGRLDRNDDTRVLALPHHAERAVRGVTLAHAREYVAWRAELLGARLRLPTRAEWRRLVTTPDELASNLAAGRGSSRTDPGAHFGVRQLFDGTGELVLAGQDAASGILIVGRAKRGVWTPTPEALEARLHASPERPIDAAFRLVMPLVE